MGLRISDDDLSYLKGLKKRLEGKKLVMKDGKLYSRKIIIDKTPDKIVGANLTKKQRMDKIKKDTKKYRKVLMMG